MRRRRKSIAPWLFVFGGLLLLAAGATALFVRFQPEHEISQFVADKLRVAGGDWLDVLRVLGGLAIAAWGTAFSLLMGWHFLEMNLPRRIEELKDYHLEDHLALRPQLIAVAKNRLRIPADIGASRFTLVRRWLGHRTLKGQARLLAATATRLSEEAAALTTAAREAQAQTITAYLVRGFQYVSRGENARAFAEFELAARVSPTDIFPRDIAAGWARCVNNQTRELELLHEIQQIAGGGRLHVDQARALRREAELIAKESNKPAYERARDRLYDAENILLPLVGSEARRELGRVYTLFCEMRCNLARPGKLNGPNQPLTRALDFMTGIATHRREEEPCGEEYGEERAKRVEQRVTAMLGNVGQEGDDTEISDA
jgi:hypothetical protein